MTSAKSVKAVTAEDDATEWISVPANGHLSLSIVGDMTGTSIQLQHRFDANDTPRTVLSYTDETVAHDPAMPGGQYRLTCDTYGASDPLIATLWR